MSKMKDWRSYQVRWQGSKENVTKLVHVIVKDYILNCVKYAEIYYIASSPFLTTYCATTQNGPGWRKKRTKPSLFIFL